MFFNSLKWAAIFTLKINSLLLNKYQIYVFNIKKLSFKIYRAEVIPIVKKLIFILKISFLLKQFFLVRYKLFYAALIYYSIKSVNFVLCFYSWAYYSKFGILFLCLKSFLINLMRLWYQQKIIRSCMASLKPKYSRGCLC